MDNDSSNKTLELDKICRVCLLEKKDMRPLHGEMISEMLMEFARIQVSANGKSCDDRADALNSFQFPIPFRSMDKLICFSAFPGQSRRRMARQNMRSMCTPS